jgi:ADP-ribose pyrophosphatase YjhB (NUDIX family)
MIDRRVNVRGIIYKDDKILAQKLLPGIDGAARNYWCTPGGGLEENESLIEGLTREMVEETGIVPKIGKLLFIQQFQDNSGHREKEQLEFFFNIENVDDYKVIDLSKTSHGLIEIQTTDLINPKTSYILPKFLQTIDIHDYVVNNRPVFIFNELPKN